LTERNFGDFRFFVRRKLEIAYFKFEQGFPSKFEFESIPCEAEKKTGVESGNRIVLISPV